MLIYFGPVGNIVWISIVFKGLDWTWIGLSDNIKKSVDVPFKAIRDSEFKLA